MIEGEILRYAAPDERINLEEYLNWNFATIEQLLKQYGNANMHILTKAEYDALPDTKYTDGVMYFLKDYTED